MKTLCIDIGNTRIKAVWYQGKDVFIHQVYTHDDIQWDILLDESPLDAVAVSNVTGRRDYSILSSHVSFYLDIDENTPLPFANHYQTPETLGHDRIAAVCGAYAQYPQSSLCVIDIGTCMTLDFLEHQRGYLGGNISPGVDLRLKAMHHFTSGLPLLQREEVDGLLGRSTSEAMMQGAVQGCLYEIEGFVLRLAHDYGSFKTVLTGGGAKAIASKMKSETFVHENLIPDGLNYLVHEIAD